MLTPLTMATDDNYNRSHVTVKIDKDNKTIVAWLYGVIDDWPPKSYDRLITTFLSADEDYVAYLNIDSPGGVIPVACDIIGAMIECKAKIITRNIGQAMSCGSLILAFGDEIAIADNSITMFHSSAIGFGSTVSQVARNRVDHLVQYVDNLLVMMQKKGLVTDEEYDGITNRHEEYFITADVMRERLRKVGLLYEGEILP